MCIELKKHAERNKSFKKIKKLSFKSTLYKLLLYQTFSLFPNLTKNNLKHTVSQRLYEFLSVDSFITAIYPI